MGDFEFAADGRTEMGLISWVEAAPDVRQERIDARSLIRRVRHDSERH